MIKLFSFVLLSMLPTALFADTMLVIKDTYGNPLAGAVVSYTLTNTLAPSEAPQKKRVAVMDQVDKQFKPRVLVIEQGQQVSFPNSDNIRHHVYSFSQPKPFEIKLYKGKNSQPVTFEKQGLVVLGCNIHDSMVGYIYVKGQQKTYLSDADGKVTLHDKPEEVTIWHESLSLSNSERRTIKLTNITPQTPYVIELRTVTKSINKKSSFKKRFGDK